MVVSDVSCNTLKTKKRSCENCNFFLKEDDLKEGKEPLPRDRR